MLDEEALLTTLAYVDLNPLAARIVKTPENHLTHPSKRTSITAMNREHWSKSLTNQRIERNTGKLRKTNRFG